MDGSLLETVLRYVLTPVYKQHFMKVLQYSLIFKLLPRDSEEGKEMMFILGSWCTDFHCRYAPIGAILMSKRIADGIRDNSGFWKHGHTYQV
jgi:hypothetical protein